MALRPATLPIRFQGGLETKLDDKVVPLGRFLELRDAVFKRGGTAAKRYGNELLSGIVLGAELAMAQPVALGQRDAELLAFAEANAYSYIDSVDRWSSAGACQSVITSMRPVAKTGSNQTLATCAVNAGVALYAWEDSRGGVWYSLLDDETGRTLVAPTRVADAAAERPRAVAIGDSLQLLYALVAPREIRALRWLAAAPLATPSTTILIADLSGTVPVYDLDDDGEKGVLAWATPTQVGVGYLHSSGVMGGAGVGLAAPIYIAATVATSVAVATDKSQASASRTVAVAWTEAATRVRYALRSATLTSVLAASSVDAGGAPVPTKLTACWQRDADAALGRVVLVAYEDSAAAAQNYTVTSRRMSTTGAGETARTTRGVGLGTKAFADGASVYLHLLRDSTLYRTYFCMRSDGLVVARFLSGLAGGLVAKAHLPAVQDVSGDARRHFFPAIYVTDVESANGNIFTEKGIRRVDLDFSSDEAFRAAQLGRTLYIAGGMVQAYDGERIVEAGFHYGIDDVAAPVLAAPTGVGIAPGTRNYVFVPEGILANGEVERGPVSAAITVTIPAGPNQRATFAVPTVRLTRKASARIGVYRTVDGDPASYNRVSSLDPSATGPNGYLANDPTVDTVTFIDEMTDADLENQEPLYTNGGIVPNDPLGGARLIAGGKNRLLVVDAADPLAFYFTQELAEGYAAEFSPRLRGTVDPFGGEITAAVVMDDLNVLFKRAAILGFTGPGPFANPSLGGGFSPTQLITSDVGCVSPDSIGYTPAGVIFQSLKGIYLLGRDRSVRYIGAPVERFTDPSRENQRVVATTLIEDRHEIRLLMSSGESLFYDYEYDSWSSSSIVGVDAVLVGGVYHHLRSNGSIWRETVGEYADGGLHINHFIRTPHIPIAQILSGFQRIWTLEITGEYYSPHTLRIRAFYDFEAGHDDEWIIDPATFINLPGYGEGDYGEGDYGEGAGGQPSRRYQFSVAVYRQCAAVQFTFEFIEASGVYGAAGALTEMVVRGGVLGDRYPQADARRA